MNKKNMISIKLMCNKKFIIKLKKKKIYGLFCGNLNPFVAKLSRINSLFEILLKENPSTAVNLETSSFIDLRVGNKIFAMS